MRDSQKDKDGTPEPEAPWHEIVPGLWTGGHHWATAEGPERRRTGRLGSVIVESSDMTEQFSRASHHPAPEASA
ncbi:hypothetical protein [Streptomyces sp. NPDC048623]|uniref:hypothetical protein n=1 Tax=Streptomyces sp. NPDC048623 TaxID=3155761 RepID=UPI003418A32A